MIDFDGPGLVRSALPTSFGFGSGIIPPHTFGPERSPTDLSLDGGQNFSPNIAREMVQSLSLGRSVVKCNGWDPNAKPVVIFHNFIPSIREKGGEPLQIDATPDDNKATGLIAAPCLDAGEIGVCVLPAPGFLEYHRDRGLIHPEAKVIVVNPEARNGKGFPYFDALSLATQQGIQFPDAYMVSAFTSPFVREQARHLGLTPVQSSDSFLTNNKAVFREAAAAHGFTVCPGRTLNTEQDVLNAAETFRHSRVWQKFPGSFGGDLLAQIESPVTAQALCVVRDRMRASVARAFQLNDYGGLTLDQYWPNSSFSPLSCSITVEQDARELGEVVAIGSNVMEVSHDGAVNIRGYFRQIIGPAGDFWGSMSFDPEQEFGAELKDLLDAEFQAIGRHAAIDLSLFGIMGVDFMILRSRSDGHLFPVNIELNGRPPISASSFIVGQKLGAPAFVSRYMWAPTAICNMDDFERSVTVSGHNYSRASAAEGAIIPMMLTSLYEAGEAGEPKLIRPKHWCQVLATGPTVNDCQGIFNELTTKNGMSFQRPQSGDW